MAFVGRGPSGWENEVEVGGLLKSEDSKRLPEFGHYVDVNGLRMYYEDRGMGIPLILVHGGLLTGSLGWGDLRRYFAEHFRVITPDCRGCGRTDNPQGTMDYRVMADDVVALAKALDLVNPIIGGWSDGGQVALEIGIRYPDFTKALVVGAAQHKLSQKTKEGLLSVRDWLESQPELTDTLRAAHSHVYGSEYMEIFVDKQIQMWTDSSNYPQDDIKRIEVPTLLIVGDKDEAVPLETQIEMLDLIPQAELAIIPSMTHMNYVDERCELFYTVVLDFLKRLS
jgi:pimeloyl-ACP methyl ester carboxylesterase